MGRFPSMKHAGRKAASRIYFLESTYTERTMDQKRGLFRLSIKRTGRLIKGTDATPCEVLDLTDKGMLIEAGCAVSVEDELLLEFPLTTTTLLQCTIHVTHVAAPQLGARIVAISSEHRQALSRFIEELLALNVTGF